MQGTAEFHPQITDPVFPEAEAVLHDTQRLTLLLTCSIRRRSLSAWFARCSSGVSSWPGLLRRHEDHHLRERERQEAQILQSRLRAGKGYSVASPMGLSWVRPP